MKDERVKNIRHIIKVITSYLALDYDIINSISEIEYSPTKNSDGNITDEDIFIFKMNNSKKSFWWSCDIFR